jgi:hypothetical protein
MRIPASAKNRRRTMKIGLCRGAAGAAIAAAVLVTAPASAQPRPAPAAAASAGSGYTERQDADGSQVIDFGNDLVVDGTLNIFGDVVKPPPLVTRAALIRPRMNFVPELITSVENL